MKSHELHYKIFGDDLQFVEIDLDPTETVIGEAGAMVYMEDGVDFETKMGDGSKPDQGWLSSLGGAAKRVLSGESVFLTHFTNRSQALSRVAFGAAYPGKILGIDLDEVNGKLIAQKDAFLCAALGTEVSIIFNKKIGSGLFGGEGFVLQKLEGDGLVFVHAGGTIVEKQLNGDRLRVDTGCVVAFESQIDYDIQTVSSIKSALFGGEGIFLTTLQGTGRVWLQSLPFSRLADRVLEFAPSIGGGQSDEMSVIKGAMDFLQR
jgi:uncharacterized protein (TIGR00266 family)